MRRMGRSSPFSVAKGLFTDWRQLAILANYR